MVPSFGYLVCLHFLCECVFGYRYSLFLRIDHVDQTNDPFLRRFKIQPYSFSNLEPIYSRRFPLTPKSDCPKRLALRTSYLDFDGLYQNSTSSIYYHDFD